MNAENNISNVLNALSDEVNQLYGYVKIPGDNFDEPAINSGPCGPFANAYLNTIEVIIRKYLNPM